MTIIENKSFDAERIFYASKELTIRRCSFDGFADGGSAFKECQDISAENSFFNLRYPFWHGENITVRNSVIKGEYLAWYSDGLTLEHCRIIGTQPFCYCKKLKLVDCEMVDTDLAFEKSDVEATVITPIVSIKNPRSGNICVPSVGEIIRDEPDAKGEICICEKQYEKTTA